VRSLDDLIREKLHVAADVVDPFTHEALDGIERTQWVLDGVGAGVASDCNFSVGRERDEARNKRISLLVADNHWSARGHIRSQRVGGAQIDSEDRWFAHVIWESSFLT